MFPPQNVIGGPMNNMMIPNIPEQMMMMNQMNQKFQYQTHLVVTDIHENATQTMIWEHFQRVGPIFSLKLTNLKKAKVAFITYFNFKDAQDAQKNLNNSEILGKKIRVLTYIRSFKQIKESYKCNLILKKLGETITEKHLQEYFKSFGEILSCKVMYDEAAKKSRGYGYIQFKLEESAKKVLEKQQQENITINNVKIIVEEFHPYKVREQSRNPNCLFVCNLPYIEDPAGADLLKRVIITYKI
jgi:polyadenylate-binding protein